MDLHFTTYCGEILRLSKWRLLFSILGDFFPFSSKCNYLFCSSHLCFLLESYTGSMPLRYLTYHHFGHYMSVRTFLVVSSVCFYHLSPVPLILFCAFIFLVIALFTCIFNSLIIDLILHVFLF